MTLQENPNFGVKENKERSIRPLRSDEIIEIAKGFGELIYGDKTFEGCGSPQIIFDLQDISDKERTDVGGDNGFIRRTFNPNDLHTEDEYKAMMIKIEELKKDGYDVITFKANIINATGSQSSEQWGGNIEIEADNLHLLRGDEHVLQITTRSWGLSEKETEKFTAMNGKVVEKINEWKNKFNGNLESKNGTIEMTQYQTFQMRFS